MKALVIGAAGFVGGYLVRCLRDTWNWDVSATKLAQEKAGEDIPFFDLDLADQKGIVYLLEQVKPDYIFHLAAQSSVALSWQKPELTVNVNVNGTLHLLDAVRSLA